MKRYRFYPLVACALMMIAACKKSDNPGTEVKPADPIVLTAKQAEKVTGDNMFAFRLFQKTAGSGENTNAFISPLSVNMAMGMLYNGASGDARAEMAETLGLADFTDEEINEYYQKMSQALLGIDPLTTLHIANSIWYRNDYSVKQSFFDTNTKYYDAEVKGLDFSAPATVGIINNWCAKNTGNKITEIIDVIPGDAVMYLINAVYFKSKWVSQFDKSNTKPGKFTLQNGSQTDVSMMEQTEVFPYYADDKLRCVELPYGNQAFGMMVLLPAEGTNLNSVIESLDNEYWQQVLTGLYDANIYLKLPRFKQECEFELNEFIKELGITSIFESGNLDGIADDPRLAVSRIKHKTFVDVNEEGTEAAAVTSVEVLTMSAGPDPAPIVFHVDQPFIYLIKEKSTGIILFIGRMDQPKG